MARAQPEPHQVSPAFGLLVIDVWGAAVQGHAVDLALGWLLNTKGVPAGPILNVREVFENEQVRHLGLAQPLRHPVLGDLTVQGPPVVLSRTPGTIRTAAPDPGEHTEEILGELGCSSDEIKRFRQEGVV